MIRINIPEDFINDIISDIKKLTELNIRESTKKLFNEIKIQAKNLENNRLTKEEEALGIDLSSDIFEFLSSKDKVKKEIMECTKKHLGDDSLEFDHIHANLKRKNFTHTLLERPVKRYYNLYFEINVSYKILNMIEDKMEIDIFSPQDIETCKNCKSWGSSLDSCMGCIKIEIKKTLKDVNR